MKNPFVDDYGISPLGGVAILLGALFAFILACMALAYWSESAKCSSIARLTGDATDVSLSAGCLVQHKGKWMTGDTALSNRQEIEISEAAK
jgi:hypothetical protein